MNDLFESGNYYHVYNRAIGGEKLFLEKENYEYFLFKWQEFINPIADIYAYCLMPNHFHFLLKLKWLPSRAYAGANLQGGVLKIKIITFFFFIPYSWHCVSFL
ncbi:MAG: hypothetical protein JXR53_15915, partial [Bacteroidales bacterium]|nr:hypothetical protein [Bacteroidales bacterium]